MTRMERTHPGTKVSDWASGIVNAPLPTTYFDERGYVIGGQIGSYTDKIQKFRFIDDSRSTLSAVLSNARLYFGAAADGHVAGYVYGGRNGGFHDKVAKIIFANDTCSDISSTLSATRSHNSAFADSGTAGYCIGGTNSSWNVQATVDKFAFPGDARSTLGTGLSAASRKLAGMAK